MVNFPEGKYRGVDDLCAVQWTQLIAKKRVTKDEIDVVLKRNGFLELKVSMSDIGRQCIGASRYECSALPHLAPAIVNCRTIIKWIYGQKGIWFPNRIADLGRKIENLPRREGDLVFVSDETAPSGGHVGMMTDCNTVIHANQGINLVEEPFLDFTNKNGGSQLREVRRIIANIKETHTYICPADLDIEWSADIIHIVSHELGDKK